MRALFLLLLGLLLCPLVISSNCDMKPTFIPSSSMSNFVTKYVNSVVPSNKLTALILDPSSSNLLEYSKSLMPIIIPIFAFAVIACIFCVVACIQICCVGCCNSQKCRCSNYTFSSIKILLGLTILFLLLLIGGGVAGMIFNHDVLAATSNTGCVAEDVFDNILVGDNTTGWNGLTGLSAQINQTSQAFGNNIESIQNFFSGTTTTFTNLTPGTPGTLYANVQTSSACTLAASNPITCPDGTTSCEANAINQFCDSTISGSGGYMIGQEFNQTTSIYGNDLIGLSNTITAMEMNSSGVISALDNASSSVSSFSISASDYRSSVSTISTAVNQGLYWTEIAIYVAYSFLILCSLMGMFMLIGIFYCRCFKMTGCVQFSWIFYWFMTTIIFIIAGLQYLTSVGMVNTCSSISYFTSSQANFQQLGNLDILNGYSNCLFNGATNFLPAAFPAMSNSNMNDLTNYMNKFNNLGPFSTVETTVYDNVMNYYNNPETVVLQSGTQPLAALNNLNNYANWVLNNGTTQTCEILKDLMVFNTFNCSQIPLVTGTNNHGNNSCVLLTNGTTVSARQAYLLDNPISNCSTNDYSNGANNLAGYSNSLQTTINSTLIPTTLLTSYAPNYYTYYDALQDYLSPSLLSQINSFVQPYNTTQNGIQCSFLISQTQQLQDQVCNKFNPYLYFLAVINISIGSICFMLMLMFYYLHPRLEYYAQVETGQKEVYMQTLDSARDQTIELVTHDTRSF